MWIERRAEATLRRFAATRPIVLVTGPRQVGKTSLLRRCFPSASYESLDLPSAADAAASDGVAFLRRLGEPLILDEVQYAPAVLRCIKRVVDDDRERCGRFLITGSQRLAVMQGVTESLAGRVGLVDLEGLSYSELAPGRDVEPAEAMLRGGYPELWARPELDAAEFYRDYVATYLERDVRNLLRVASLRDFERCVRACALRSGHILNRADLARDIGVSATTANEWLGVLAAASVLQLVEPWYSNLGKALTKSPKLYFADTGLLSFLIGMGRADASHPLVGSVWETFVFGEVRRHVALMGTPSRIAFYRDRSREVDFVYERDGSVHLIEAKWTERPTSGDATALMRLAESVGTSRVAGCWIVCRTPYPFNVNDTVRAIGIADLAEALAAP